MDKFKEVCLEEPSQTMRFVQLLFVAGAFSLGGLFLILASALYGNWYPLFSILAYAIAPIPILVCGFVNQSDLPDEANKTWMDLGFFLTGAFIVAGFGVPSVLAHSGTITTGAFGFALAGGVITYSSIILYFFLFYKKWESEDSW